MEILKELSENIIQGQASKCEELTKHALDQNISPEQVLNQGLIAGMEVVSEKFKSNEFFVPEVLIAARAMKSGMNILRPVLIETGIKPVGKFVIGTAKGDLHDIGKNLVAMMLEGAGFEVIDLGVDVSPEKYVETVKDNGAQVLGMSALLTTTMQSMKSTIEALENTGIRASVKVIIGGAPITRQYAEDIGADGYAPDAASAVDAVKNLLET